MEKKKTANINELISIKPVRDLSKLFKNNNEEIYLVGGSTRDALLDIAQTDLDFTTSARPEKIIEITKDWADNIWTTGAAFGTISMEKNNFKMEVTTFRKDIYRIESRKPKVNFSDKLEEDLIRRDFTVNAIAVQIEDASLIDPFDGVNDLKNRILRTPSNPDTSFSDDPLRMLRACRFVSTLLLRPTKELVKAIERNAERLVIISKERIREELSRLLLGINPAEGLKLMVDTGVAEYIVPELPALRLTRDEHFKHKDVLYHTYLVVNSVRSDLTLRLTALLHDIAKPKTRTLEKGEVHFYGHDILGSRMAAKRLRDLRYPNSVIKDVTKLIKLHLRPYGYGLGWTDSAVRRYARDAGELVGKLNEFAIADCTTGVAEKAKKNLEQVKDLEKRISKLSEEEELSKIRPPITGNEVMDYLKLQPGPKVGKAMNVLLEATLDGKIKTKSEAKLLLDKWAEKELK